MWDSLGNKMQVWDSLRHIMQYVVDYLMCFLHVAIIHVLQVQAAYPSHLFVIITNMHIKIESKQIISSL